RGAGDGDVQTTFSALPIEGAEVHRHRLPARRRRAIADRKQNDVALIALHGLQVLHEDRLPSLSTFLAGYEEALELRIGPSRLIEEVFDEPLLLRVEGYDADRELTQLRIVQSSNDLGYDGFRLDLVRARSALRVDAVDSPESYRGLSGIRRRIGDQGALIVGVIREADQAFVAAAVVARQPMVGDARGERLIQNAFEITCFFVLVILGPSLEETRRRHLARIADDDAPPPSGNRADRIGHGDLTRFVEDDEVEELGVRRQELSHRQRAHHEARREGREGLAHFSDELPDRLVAHALLQLSGEDTVARMALRGVPRGNLTRQLRANIGGRHLGELSVEGPEGVDEILVLDCRETLQGRPRIDEYRRNPAGIGGAERFDRLIWRNCAGLERRQEASQACLSSFARNGNPATPRLEPRFALYDRLCAVEESAQIFQWGCLALVGLGGRAEPLQAV